MAFCTWKLRLRLVRTGVGVVRVDRADMYLALVINCDTQRNNRDTLLVDGMGVFAEVFASTGDRKLVLGKEASPRQEAFADCSQFCSCSKQPGSTQFNRFQQGARNSLKTK
jgi:hypothetical protein